MNPEDRKRWLYQEEARLTHYQHQHRGLSFQKLLLPPIDDRKVNLVGLDNHIYKGSIRKVAEDQLPENVDEKSIDEEELYKEIRDMNFPAVPKQEPLGPRRRIEGEYTLPKRMMLAPFQVWLGEDLENIQILGQDGGIYRGTVKHPSKIELEKQVRGSKRPLQKIRETSSSRGFIEPSLISLHTEVPAMFRSKTKKSLLKIPTSNARKLVKLIKSKADVIQAETIQPDKADQDSEADTAEKQQVKTLEETGPSETADKINNEETETESKQNGEANVTDTDETSETPTNESKSEEASVADTDTEEISDAHTNESQQSEEASETDTKETDEDESKDTDVSEESTEEPDAEETKSETE